MSEIMKQGKINCECGNEFYFESIQETIPCMKCGKMHKNEGGPVQIEEGAIEDEEIKKDTEE